jgi:adenylosuccinate synthase
VAVKYSAMLSGATGIGVMLLDVLAGFETLKVCTGYRYKGTPLANFPGDAAVLDAVEPIYEELPGFTEAIDGCRSFADLPEAAQEYVKRIEAYVGVPVRVISVGPRRDQTLVR